MCLEKNPAVRYSSAAEVREALKTIMKAMQLETGGIPGDAAANLVTTGPEVGETLHELFVDARRAFS